MLKLIIAGLSRRLPLLLFVSGVSLALAPAAQANLQVFPTRLVLSDSQRTGQLSLRLAGNKPQKFRISAVFYRMNPDASLELVENPAASERPAKALIRFSPRSVELQPGVEQVLRVMQFSSKPLQEGEYRAHLLFEPVVEEGGPSGDAGEKSAAVAMQLQAKIAIAIPVIVRKGNPRITGALSALRMLKTSVRSTRPSFEAQLTKSGDGFLFGDLDLAFLPDGGTEAISLAKIIGVSSYIPSRLVRYPFDVPENVNLKQGRLRLQYRTQPESGGELIAEVEARVP